MFNYQDLKSEFIEYLYLNKYDETNIAIHCDSPEKAEILIMVFSLLGKQWGDNAPLISQIPSNDVGRVITRWNKDKESTCYRVNEISPKNISRGRKQYYENKSDTVVVEFEDVFKSIASQFNNVVETDDEQKKQKHKKTGFMSSILKQKNNSPQPQEHTEVFYDTENRNEISDTSSQEEPEQTSEIVNEENDVNTVIQEKSVETEEDLHSEIGPETTKSENITNENKEKETPVEENITEIPSEDEKTKEETPDVKEPEAQNEINKSDAKDEIKVVDNKDEENPHETTESGVTPDTETNIFSIFEPYKPFKIEGSRFKKRIFRFNSFGQREELKTSDYWIQCNMEWELSYILLNPEKVKYIGE